MQMHVHMQQKHKAFVCILRHEAGQFGAPCGHHQKVREDQSRPRRPKAERQMLENKTRELRRVSGQHSRTGPADIWHMANVHFDVISVFYFNISLVSFEVYFQQ